VPGLDLQPLSLPLILLNALTLGGVLSGLFVATLWAFSHYPHAAPWFAALYAISALNCVWRVLRPSGEGEKR